MAIRQMTHKTHAIRGHTVKLAIGIDDFDLVDFSVVYVCIVTELKFIIIG